MKQKSSTQKKRQRTVFILLTSIALCLAVIVLFLPRESFPRDTRAAPAEKERESVPAGAPAASKDSGKVGVLPPQKKPRPPAKEATIAVVIDDAGYNLTDLEMVLAFSSSVQSGGQLISASVT